jgi:enoyl-CoA hydratase/carnithine racemase
MEAKKILLEPIEGITIIRLNDPDSLNPMTLEMSVEFVSA